jgi:hypothetical protein
VLCVLAAACLASGGKTSSKKDPKPPKPPAFDAAPVSNKMPTKNSPHKFRTHEELIRTVPNITADKGNREMMDLHLNPNECKACHVFSLLSSKRRRDVPMLCRFSECASLRTTFQSSCRTSTQLKTPTSESASEIVFCSARICDHAIDRIQCIGDSHAPMTATLLKLGLLDPHSRAVIVTDKRYDPAICASSQYSCQFELE